MASYEDVKALIKAVETEDSANGLIDAVKALATTHHEAAIPMLIEVLGYNNPGAAVAAVDGLIEMGEVAVPYLLELMDGYNYGARSWATRACAGIGDPRTLDLLLEAASSDFALSVRRAAAKGLGSIRWHKIPASEVTQAQQQILQTLLQVTGDPEWVVRYAAVVGLELLALTLKDTQPQWIESITVRLQQLQQSDPVMAVRARICLVWQQISQF